MASLPVAEAREDVAVLFLSYLGRAPEFTAMNYYVGLYNQLLAAQGDTAAAEDNAFKALSAQIYVDAGNVGEIPTGPSVTDAEYVNWIYQNVLGRAADQGGLDYWVLQLGNGAIERADLVGIVVAAAQNDVRDAAYLANRTEVALEFAKFENSNPQIIDSLPFNAKQVLEGVDADPATVAAAQAKLVSATNGGETFTLTPGVDNIVGTSGDDVFNAVPVNATTGVDATTLNAYDTIDGGQGRDTLNIYVGYNAQTNKSFNDVQQGTVRNVEIINIHNNESSSANFFGTDNLVNAGAFQGAEQVWQFTRATIVTNLSASTVAGFADLDNTSSVYVTAASDASSAAIAFKDVSTWGNSSLMVTVMGDALASTTVTGALIDAQADDGVDAHMDITLMNTDAKAKDLSFSLATEVDAVVNLWSTGATAKIVGLDASASTGDIDFTVNTADLKSVKGGSGDDAFTFARALTLTDSVDGGEGIDTVTLAGQGTVLATQDYDAIANLQNIDILAFQTSNITVDASKLAFEQIGFDVSNGGAVTINKLGADQVVLVTAQDDGPASITLNNAAVDAALELFDADQDIFLTIGARADDVTGGTLAVSGEGRLSYSNTDAQFATIDVSELEGGFALGGLVGTVAETIVLGAGSTVITLNVGTPSSTVGLLDTITGFDATTTDTDPVRDYLSGVTIQADAVSTTGLTDIKQAWAKAAEAYDEANLAGNGVLLFQYGGDTYLYASNSDTAGRFNNTDFAIKLVGLYTVEQLDTVS